MRPNIPRTLGFASLYIVGFFFFGAPPANAATCGTPAACNSAGVTATKKGDFKTAFKLFEDACKGNDASGCYNCAVFYLQGKGKKKDYSKAFPFLKKACSAGDAGGCYNGGVLLLNGMGVKKDGKQALSLFIKACQGKHYGGCNNAGVVLIKGPDVPRDLKRARAFFKTGCAGGDKSACKGVKVVDNALGKKKSEPTKSGTSNGKIAGSNVNVGSMKVDGLEVKQLSCKLPGAGFLAAAQVVGGLSKQKKALKRCGKKGAQARVRWSYAGGRATSIEVSGVSGKVKGCVKRAMKKVKGNLTGTCSASILLGP
jgi:hypothetical protein